MFITIITNDLQPLWAIKAQFSTRPNWASKLWLFFVSTFPLQMHPAGYNKADDIEFIIKATYDTSKDPVELAGLQVTKTDSTVISTGSDAYFNADMQTGKVATNVVNTTGPQLPSTGGMGTTLFYVLGSVLLLGAVVLLVVRRRMRTEK